MITKPLNMEKVVMIRGLEELSQFKSLDEFHQHVTMWADLHEEDFTSYELDSLRWLIVFSESLLGVSNEKFETILKAVFCSGDATYDSLLSVGSMLVKAAKLGIINVYQDIETEHESQPNLVLRI